MEFIPFYIFLLKPIYMTPVRICLSFILALGAAAHTGAQTTHKLAIRDVTVFLSGAELHSDAELTLARGENDIVFTNVAGDVNDKSTTVAATNGVVVESVTFQNNYLAPRQLSVQAEQLKDSIALVTNSQELIRNKITVLSKQSGLLWKADSNLRADEMAKMLDLINARMEGYLDQKSREENLLKKTDEILARLQQQLNEIASCGNRPEGVLKVKFFAGQATRTSVSIRYVSAQAGWMPTYDIYADKIDAPARMFYKANIHQRSGISWDNVRLSLSTGNPTEGGQAPVLPPWYLAFYVPPPETEANNRKFKMAAPMATMQWSAGSSSQTLNTGITNADGPEGTTGVEDYVTVDNSGVYTTFDIDLPYTIPSDGQLHLISVKRYEAPATYRYVAIPKLDKDVFLQARLTHWQDLNLLAGPTNIFYEGAYIGQGAIDPHNLTDTLDVSLGRDKKIVVTRQTDKTQRSVKTIGSNVRETFGYTISVHNTRKEAINLTIQDQQPVSNDNEIVLEDADTGGGELDPTTGIITWTLSLAPNETRKLSFGFTVKYPKGKTVENLK